ncbi:MAG: NADH-quinone oxidoreductase subunit J [Saezia sp.]
MQFAFYISALIAVVATLRVITHTKPVHALLYLIVSLLGISGVFFSLGAYFAGALEIIVYAGAIMVLFVFIVMMLNLSDVVERQERAWLQPKAWIIPSILSLLLLMAIVVGICSLDSAVSTGIAGTPITPKDVGISLFSTYVLMVELAAMILLGSLVVAYHIGHEYLTLDTEAERDADMKKDDL